MQNLLSNMSLVGALSALSLRMAFGVEPALAEGCLSVAAFGAKGDGHTDDTEAFQRALDAAAPVGGWVSVPPVGGGRGYVISHMVTVPEGVSLIGAPSGTGTNVRAVFSLPESHIVGPKIFARPQASEYRGPKKRPLFKLEAGATVRGFWIMYDEQPLPSDEEFADPESPYHYATFADARKGFFKDHVRPYGPTFYSEGAVNIVIEDVTCDRFYDFLYFVAAGKSHIQRISLHGYNRGFAIEHAADVLHIDNVEWVPNGGPTSPGGPYNGKTYTWAYALILARPDNVGMHLGRVDGYSFYDVTFFSIHTALRLGYSPTFPMRNPVTGTDAPLAPRGAGPWGDIAGFRADQCVIGLHFVWPTHLTNRLANTLIFTGYQDGTAFEAAAGSGDLDGISRQAAFLVEPSHSKENNAGYVSTCMIANAVVASFNDSARFAPVSANVANANGRAILIDGDLFLELANLQINAPYRPGLVWAAGPHARDYRIRARGYTLAFQPQPDLELAPEREAGAAP